MLALFSSSSDKANSHQERLVSATAWIPEKNAANKEGSVIQAEHSGFVKLEFSPVLIFFDLKPKTSPLFQ